MKGQPQLVFVAVPYKVETEETEHIAISHIAKQASRDGDGGTASGRSIGVCGCGCALSLIHI